MEGPAMLQSQQHRPSEEQTQAGRDPPYLEVPAETQPASQCSAKMKGKAERHTEGTDRCACVVFLRHRSVLRMGTLALMALLWAQSVAGQPMQRQLPGTGAIIAF